MDKVQNSVILCVLHHRQNRLESTLTVHTYTQSSFIWRFTYLLSSTDLNIVKHISESSVRLLSVFKASLVQWNGSRFVPLQDMGITQRFVSSGALKHSWKIVISNYNRVARKQVTSSWNYASNMKSFYLLWLCVYGINFDVKNFPWI
jgi:hypothetical protein